MSTTNRTVTQLRPYWAHDPLPIHDCVEERAEMLRQAREFARYASPLRALVRWDHASDRPAVMVEVRDISLGGFCLALTAARLPGRRLLAELIDEAGFCHARVDAKVVRVTPDRSGMWHVGCRALQPLQ